MALITKIRRNLWLVLILLGLALAAFILMDMTSSQNMGGSTQFNVGAVNGEDISWQDFQNAENVLYSGSAGNIYGKREALWNYMVRTEIFEQEAEEIGFNVTDEEMEELQFGNNISPVIERNFADPQTGRLNAEALNNFRQALNAGTLPPQSQRFWEFQKGQIRSDRLQSKLQNLVIKGMYMPEWSVTKRHYENNNKMDFAYVQIPFDKVDDSQVNVSDADIQAYIDANPGEYTIDEENRNLVYVGFNVEPTKQDSVDIIASLGELRADFEKMTDGDSLFVENNYGQIEDTYYKKSVLSSYLQDTIEGMEVGGIVGPYQDGNDYKVAKLMDKKVIADSVKVRHILRSVQEQAQYAPAAALLDSLKKEIESGRASFDSLAPRFSQDPGSGAKGGDLGYTAPGRMVPQFNNLIFYKANPGELKIVATQFGLHLVEVTDQKFLGNEESYRVAYLKEAIIPSEETQNVKYDEVSQFVGKNRTYADLEKTVNADESLEFKFANGLLKNSYAVGDLPESNASRNMVKWAFDSDVEPGNVSPEIYTFEDDVNYFNSQYVVAALTAINPAGKASVATVRDEVRGKVVKEKKGEIIKSQISNTNLASIAEKFGSKVDTAKGAVFISAFIPGLGAEPKSIGTAFGLGEGETAGPIVGNTGVYYIKAMTKEEAFEPNNIAQLRKVNSSQLPTRVANSLSDALKKMVPIEDQRSNYY